MTFKIQAGQRIVAAQKTLDPSLKKALEKAGLEFEDDSKKFLTSYASLSGKSRKMEPHQAADALKKAGFKITDKGSDKFYASVNNVRYLIGYNNKYYTTYIKEDQPSEE